MEEGHGMKNGTANLQSMTTKEIAQGMRISERQLYKAKEIFALGRGDLMEKVDAGEISLHFAWLEATGRQKATSWDRLVTAWNNATPEDHVI